MSSNPRLPGVIVEKPFVFGNATFTRDREDATDLNAYRWTVYLRSATDEDLTTYIKEVHFQLHESFNNATRIIKSAPFEVTEFGWGEFSINITVHFHPEADEPPVTMLHHLKLFPENKGVAATKTVPLISEKHDGFVFIAPTQKFYQMLSDTRVAQPSSINPQLEPFFTTNHDAEIKAMNKIAQASETAQREIEALQAKIYETEIQIQTMLQRK